MLNVRAVVLFFIVAAAVAAAWAGLGRPVPMPASPLAPGEKLECVSYAPFREGQTPWGEDIPRWQIDDDLSRLKAITDCVRTYSIDHGLDQIAASARAHGLKVIQGLWISSNPTLTRPQIDTTISLAKQYPDVIKAIVVGNEALLRGEISAPRLAGVIREVKAQVGAIPVTYADVWEFWLRNRELANEVDFITIHILPYWEDFPIAARDGPAHLDAIRKRVAAAFPGKEIFIGETGWPSAGRMREGAEPSPAAQAWYLHRVLALAKREGFRVNVIEAFDQPWKRQLEGTVGGHWGLFDAGERERKFVWGEPVSDHPRWRSMAAGGIAFAALVFAAGLYAERRRSWRAPWTTWTAIAVLAAVSGTLIGWTIRNIPLESLGVGGWLRSLAWAFVAVAAAPLAAMALVLEVSVPSFGRILGRAAKEPVAAAIGAVLVLLTILAVQAALGLVFDPRYRDFPFAPLTGAAVPFLILSLFGGRAGGPRLAAETVAAATLLLSALYILLNESFANWQSVWFCGALALLTLVQWRARAAPG